MTAQPFKVKAVFDYASEHQDDLSFPNGQIITVTEEEDDEWYYGEYKNPDGITRKGMFPRNHVERFEPVTPPRPARHPRKATESTEPTVSKLEDEPKNEAPTKVEDDAEEEPQQHEEEAPTEPPRMTPVSPEHPVAETQVQPAAVQEPTPAPTKAAAPAAPAAAPKEETATSKKPPPPVSDKPSSSSFRDRIAAFNKPAAAPVAPIKPSGLGGTGFVKKPFVPPPPSRDAYVPPPREPARVAYHREEEADRVPPTADAGAGRPAEPPPGDEGEDQPKPTSLKERIALLQKQQLEQAARHAEAAQKKEKPKRPPKKRTDSNQEAHEVAETETAEPTPGAVSRRTTTETEDDDSPVETRPPRRRTKSKEDEIPTAGSHELFSDTNDADQSAGPETEDGEQMSHSTTLTPSHPKKPDLADVKDGDEAEEAEDDEEGDEEEEEEMDPEIRRRMELRERMAKMSGGMGMGAMFGAPAGLPAAPKKKAKADTEKKTRAESNDSASAVAVPGMALPGMSIPGMHKVKSPAVEEEAEPLGGASAGAATGVKDDSDEESEVERSIKPENESKQHQGGDAEGAAKLATRGAPPPPPQERPVPPVPQERPLPPPPSQSRPVPPVPPGPPSGRPQASPPDSGSDEDDNTTPPPAIPSRSETGSSRRVPPVPPSRPDEPTTPKEPSSAAAAPPVPVPQSRAPPPPPPTSPPSQPKVAREDSESEEEVTEYEGDYDTDIAPNASHKDALTAHDKRDSTDDTLTGDEASYHHAGLPSLGVPSSRPPPPPPTSPPRSMPPPPPAAPPRNAPTEMPREAPPHPPPVPSRANDEDVGAHPSENVSTPTAEDEEDLYSASPPRRRSSNLADVSSPQHSAPLPPLPKRSLEAPREATGERRSADAPRGSIDQGFMAEDVDLRRSSQWWTQPRMPPPSLQNRNDVTCEVYETSARQENGEVISKQVNVLYLDYSTTLITARFAANDPANADLHQQHEPPPTRLRQDQLEDAHSRYGPQIAEAAKSKSNSIVGNGTPFALVAEVLGSLQTLPPVGSRAYGALVYANLANATVQQHDEIRAGDIISFRNAKLQGHRGAMNKKYAAEVGKPDHVGIVVDWDGTKKKVQAWEQGRESKKVKMESFKLGDLRSGEVKVWRPMPRTWVGWSGR